MGRVYKPNVNIVEAQCHGLIYSHPTPGTWSDDIHSLILNEDASNNHPLHVPSDEEKHKYEHNKIEGYLRALIDEVISNNFASDLCLSCKKDDDCKHDVYNSSNSILKIVDQKINCLRHKMMGTPLTTGQMLALVLYTGSKVLFISLLVC